MQADRTANIIPIDPGDDSDDSVAFDQLPGVVLELERDSPGRWSYRLWIGSELAAVEGSYPTRQAARRAASRVFHAGLCVNYGPPEVLP